MENISQENTDTLQIPSDQPEEFEHNYSPDNPPWNSLMALLLWMVSVGLIIVMPILFLMPYLSNQGIVFSDSKAMVEFASSDISAILLQLSAVIPAHIITLVLAWLIVTKFRQYSFKEMLGWDWGGYSLKQASLICFGLLVLVFAVAISANAVFGSQDNDLLRILRSSRYAVFLVAFLATFSAPIVEEVVYRGVLYSAFQKSFNVPIAVFLVTFVFAAVHFPQYWGDHATIFSLLFLSLLLTLMRVWTKSLLPCIAFHFIFNGIQSVLLILQPYLPQEFDPTTVESFIK